MFNPQAFDNSRPDGVAVLEIPARPEIGLPRLFVPLKRTQVDGEVIGPLAAMHVTHLYGYTRAQCDQVLEALYRFPLPGNAAITGVTVTFGEVEIKAELRERKEAEAEYARAKEEGRQAALLTRESPDVFTLQVAGIQPDQEITIETSYVQLAQAEGKGWSLRIPLTTAPRYVRSDEAGAAPARGQPLALLRDPGHLFSLDLLLPGAGEVDSPTHDLEITDEDGRPRVRLAARRVVPDRDFVLRWGMAQEETQPNLQVLTHEDPASGHLYFLALVAPPGSPDPRSTVSREVTLLVDRSGSMEGPKWEAATWAVKKFLDDLQEQDRFALALFHSRTRWFSQELCPAEPRTVEEARRFLDAHRDSGGTELGVALEQALSLAPGEGSSARHLLVITDAQVSDEGRILRLAEEESREAHRRRLSVLCIDSAPNSYLAQHLALKGGGVARFLTSDPKEQDITTALDEVLADWGQPVLTGLRLEVGVPGVEASGREVLSPTAVDLGDLPAGRALWVAGRLPLDSQRSPEFRLTARGETVASALGERAGGMGGCPALKALFGAWRVHALEALVHSGRSREELAEELTRLGYDPSRELSRASGRGKVYAENVRGEAARALTSLLVRESLDYGLLSSVTGFVATRTERGKAVEEAVVVSNALAHGWSESFLSAGMPSAPPPMHAASLAAPQAMYESQVSFQAIADYGAPPAEKAKSIQRPRMGLRLPLGRSQGGGRGKSPQPVSFSGKPSFPQGVAVLLDTTVPEDHLFTRLRVRFPGRSAPTFTPDLWLLVFAGDMASPAARVRLADLARQSGERPVNLFLSAGSRLRIVLEDKKGEWAGKEPRMEVVLE